MMTKTNPIDELFARLKKENRTALMPYLMAGYPDAETSLELLVAAAEAGADLIEFGIPYSDPLADGPTIQAAAEKALAGTITTDTVFDLVRRARQRTSIPVVVMTYYNTIYRYGLENFAIKAAEAGINGVISPDLPPEEAGPWKEAAARHGLATIMLAAPTSTDDRLALVAGASEGFVYCVSLTGVTGARTNLPENFTDFIHRIRAVTDKPLAVGFGIASPQHAREVSEVADGAIIGSALVSLIGKSGPECVTAVKAFIAEVRAAMDS